MALSWSRLDRRRRALALVVGGAVLVALGGWLATLSIESPREAAAKASAPEPSLITVAVESREVGEELVTRGVVTATQTVEAVTPLAGSDSRRALVSGRVPVPGDEVKAGDVVTEVSGRPIIALQADVPAYRDLGLGDSGPDMARLNAALADAGFSVDRKSDAYDDAARKAVEALYDKAGYGSDGRVPAGEVVFVSALPASVVYVSAAVGTELSEASVQIASGELTIAAEFPPGQAELVRPGAEVVVSSELLGESIDATVSADLAIVPNEPLASSWAGQDVRVRVVSASTGEKGLAVPVTAIVANGSGGTEVVVVEKGATSVTDANPRRVPVAVGVTGGGWAQITPVNDDLAAGDLVRLSALPGE